nr:MAG TPA: putative GntR-family transcriptional regulator [Caudoviricetes sp.]
MGYWHLLWCHDLGVCRKFIRRYTYGLHGFVCYVRTWLRASYQEKYQGNHRKSRQEIASSCPAQGFHAGPIAELEKWMDTYALQRVILKMDLLPGERYVGMVLALHLNQKTETIQVRQKTLIEETGYSRNTVQKALQRLIASGVFISQQTGRAAVLALGNNTGNMDTPNTGHQLPQKLGYRRKRKGAPFDLDTSLSTRIEELNKRDEKRFQREQK